MNGAKGIYVGGTLVSVLISLALYYSGRREAATFVGLWAPTILNLGQTLGEGLEVQLGLRLAVGQPRRPPGQRQGRDAAARGCGF